MKPGPLLGFVLALTLVLPLRAQHRTRALATTALAGQRVAILPLTLVATDPALQSDSALAAAYGDRRAALLRADSLIGEAFQARGPEVSWVLPRELRKLARRSPGIVTDPDQMGQALLRSERIKEVPDPLRAELRNLMALAGGRMALVPAALGFGREGDRGVRADLSLVLADSRSGKVLWRTLASGSGATPDEALRAALAAVLPAGTSGP